MFRCVEHVDIDAWRLRCHEERVLRHVARAVDFALVQNALVDLDLRSDWMVPVATALCSDAARQKRSTEQRAGRSGCRKPTLLPVTSIHRHVALVSRQADLRNQQVVVLILGRVGAQKQLLLDVTVVVGPAEAGEGRRSAECSQSAGTGGREQASAPAFV